MTTARELGDFGGVVTVTSGNVGLAKTNPEYRLDVGGTEASIRIAPSTTTNNALTRMVNTGGTAYIGLDGAGAGLGTAYGLHLYHSGAYPIVFSTNGVDRGRFDSSGNLLVGCTATVSASVKGVQLATGSANGRISIASNTTGGSDMMYFYNPNGIVGAVGTTGSSTYYNTSSDYRLKEDVQPMVDALDKIAALKPCTYKWKADGSAGEGFIAHELQAVVPGCVIGEKDAVDADGNPVYQGIDTSFLVATLTAAIQEQQALITSLTARIAALEGSSNAPAPV